MNFPQARQRFYHIISQAEEQINLAEAALYIAQEEYPGLEVDAYLNALDTMAAELAERLPTECYPLRTVQAINDYLFQDLGFVGNATDYYDPRNSYFNEVIDRRTGIPITLSLVYLEVARRIDFPMVGVNMPGHFLIRPDLPEMEILVDPFQQGEVLFLEDCQERLSQMYGQPIELQPAFLATVTPRRFLVRMLTNLKMIYLHQADGDRTLAMIDRILMLMPDSLVERRDRGLVYYQQGRWPEAIADLEAYLDRTTNPNDWLAIQQLLEQIRNQL